MNGTIQHYRLKNGMGVTVRLAAMGDAKLIWDMHQRLSETTIYKRYHRHYQPSLATIENLCQINEEADKGAIFVATMDMPNEIVIGIAYYLTEDDPAAAELALLVEDGFQGYGLGRQLASHARQYAIMQGIHMFYAYVLATNDAVTRLISRSGLVFNSTFAHGAREFQIELVEKPAPADELFAAQLQNLFAKREPSIY